MNNSILTLAFVFFVGWNFAQTEEIHVEYSVPNELSYGSVIDFDFFTEKLKNGKRRRTYKSMDRHFTIDCTNGYFYFEPVNSELRGHLILAPYPEHYFDTIIKLTMNVKYSQGKGYEYQRTFEYEFVLNGKQNMFLNYSGNIGEKGRVGMNKRLVGLLFYYGGNEGEDGVDGQDGSSVQVKVAPHYTESGDSIVILEVFDPKDSVLSIYRLPELYTKINLDVSGGNGGDGGAGQRGSNTFSNKKDGANGGNGGKGGNGGTATVYIHPTVEFLHHNFKFNFIGGVQGKGGEGGRAGKNKKVPFEGQPGKDGMNGQPGIPGDEPQIIFQPLELDWN